jgi:hypothetical protein
LSERSTQASARERSERAVSATANAASQFETDPRMAASRKHVLFMEIM